MENLTVALEPFRKMTSKLPFALRFKLELHLFEDIIEIEQAREPRDAAAGEWDARKEEILIGVQRLAAAFVRQAIPLLLEIDWRNNLGDGDSGLDLDNFTLSELFAEAIGFKLRAIQQAVKDTESISFDRRDIEDALSRAKTWLNRAVERCGSERELAFGDCTDIELIKRRATWPYAEYSCKFLPSGDLVPAKYEIINLLTSHVGSNSRRGLREGGWLARDRFCRVTNSWDVSENLVDWIRMKPMLCGREYAFIFDKGFGLHMKLWFFSEHTRGMSCRIPAFELTRDQFLSGLGKLKDVNIKKVGDRISLAFTQTTPIISLSEDQMIAIPELVRNGYAFSDGNGVMGIHVARAIKEAMNLKEIPGAAQIRIGGVKGMLSLDLDFRADSIGIRPSQIKFCSSHRVLEVKRVPQSNERGSNKLFKETLLVMDHLGVKCSVFYKLQERACAVMALEYDVEHALETFLQTQESNYLCNMLENGTKMDGVKFSLEELEKIKASMIAAKERVNLMVDLTVKLGIVDENDVLEENEVLVCNGRVTGNVLILRSPCMFPGDIQKAVAIPGKPDKAFTCLDKVVVFSAKGERPLPDMLGGGDLDGDDYFVVSEPELVKLLRPSEPHDFGSQDHNVQREADISQAFCAFTEHSTSIAPDIQDQLNNFGKFMLNGNLVSKTADAWLRLADKQGIADKNVQNLATMHQQALDSRKSHVTINQSQLKYMDDILDTMPVPHYKRGRFGTKSSSLLAILYEFWRHNINAVDILIKRSDSLPLQYSAPLDYEILENKQLKVSTIHMMTNLDWEKESWSKRSCRSYCVTCGDMKKRKSMKLCAVCGKDWVCVGQCEVAHWRICFGIQWRETADMIGCIDDETSVSSNTLGSFIDSKEITEDTASLTSFDDSEMSSIIETRDTAETLQNIVFGVSERPTCAGMEIDWRYLCAEDLPTLRQLALVEFNAGFEKERRDAWKRTKNKIDTPHIFDVFVMEPRLERENITLAVHVRDSSLGGIPHWRDANGNLWPRDPHFHLFRVASLSGTCRVLESLRATPLPGSLMHSALSRAADAFVEAEKDTLTLNPEIYSANLNSSQKQAVATLCSPSFKEGFFLVHGPPGTGKTITLAAMVASIGKGIVAAPSNAAVANVATKVLTIRQFNVQNVVVFGENCDESIQFLSPIHRSRHFLTFKRNYWKEAHGNKDPEALLTKFSNWLRIDKAFLLENKRDIQHSLLVGFATWLRLPLDKVSFPEIEMHCRKIDDSSKGQQVLRNFVKQAKVVLCTLNTAGSSFLQLAALGQKFQTLFLDEAAQCPEAEFYIATTFPGIKRVVLIGDPRQLNSTVLDKDCEEMGYGDSFMKHAMDLDSTKVHILDTQYRCDPSILEFSNQHFYERKISTANSLQTRKPKVDFPMKFIDTFPLGEEESEGLSSKNCFEAGSVRYLLKKDPDIKKVITLVKHASVMVITPYRAQVDLIKSELNSSNNTMNVKVDTVDSFQGQEADIVIVSLVRTRYAGFTDNSQRINVALTRAKRILRIVGDLEFWSKGPSNSIIGKLVEHCKEHGIVSSDQRLGSKMKKRMEAWMKPNWESLETSTWKANMTASFHYHIKKLPRDKKNIAFNTLIKVALPSGKDLHSLPNQDKNKPKWQMSALKNFAEELCIVWCAKEGGDNMRPLIEAHFAGSNEKCLHFIQTHPALPKGSACAKRDLSGVKSPGDTLGQSQNIEVSWTLTKSIGNAMLDDAITSLPEGCFDLDSSQKELLYKPLPLMLESGSGTGKTNVLFQHAVAYADRIRDHDDGKRCICFVTVSPRLRKELYDRYNNIEKMEKVALPTIKFYSLRELLGDLLLFAKSNKKMASIFSLCTFIEYVNSRKSHVGIGVDTKEAENEIGGVIMGSLDAAMSGAALTREAYVKSGRSYTEKNTDAGAKKRHGIYDEFEQYRKWKKENDKFDINDIVLELINKLQQISPDGNGKQGGGWVQLFNAAYLDEIQDFSYASIFLLCKIAGYSSFHWVFAGDTAQMISPGCSFTFDGLKEVLQAVQPNIKRSKIKDVNKLEKNYRVTRDVLNVSNSLLFAAKQYFKNDIQYLRPEIAENDHGTRVRICPWDDALHLEKQPKFGLKQALIYSSTRDPNGVEDAMNKWLNTHPFILTSLDSKGLEFDDCVVAFDFERKAWDISSGQVSSLRLIRELYVAITRARQRVVILIKSQKMKEFFMSLKGCNIEESDAKVALLEFDSKTTPDEWLKRGKELFDDEQFKMAASCFKAAENFGYMEWAQGLYEMEMGQKSNAKESFRNSARSFFEKAEYERTLDLLCIVMGHPPWDSADDHIYDASRVKHPSYLPREKALGFALQRNKWNEISIEDLKDISLARLFLPFRENIDLKTKISICDQHDLSEIEGSLPLLIADYYFDKGDHLNAIKLYLRKAHCSEQDFIKAEAATNLLIASSSPNNKTSSLDATVQCWNLSKGSLESESVSKGSDTFLLLQLYKNPVIIGKDRSTEVCRKFSAETIRSAFKHSNTSREELHRFSRNLFETDIDEALTTKFRQNLIEVVQWYLHHDDKARAEDFATKNIQNWSKVDLLAIVRRKLNPKGLIAEADLKESLVDLVQIYLGNELFNLNQAIKVSDRALSSIEKANANYEDLMRVWDQRRNDGRVKKRLERKQPKPPGPITIVFLNLFWKPVYSSQRLPSHCMKLFGPKIVEIAVCSTIDSTKEQFDTLSRFDKEAFKHLRPPPEKKSVPKNDSSKFKKGDPIILHGLKTLELNGKRGEILKWIEKLGRYAVKLNERDKLIKVLPANIKHDEDSDSSDEDAPSDNQRQNRTSTSKAKAIQMQSQARPPFFETGSSEDGSDGPPAPNSRDDSSSEDSSSSDSVPSLRERGNKSYSSDSSEDSDTDSTSSSLPALTRKDNSSSDDEDIPSLISPNQQSSSSSDESGPRRAQRGRGLARNNPGRGGSGPRGRGRRGGRGRR